MLFCMYAWDQPISLEISSPRQRSARHYDAGPKGAPPAIPPIIITPFNYETPKPAIDPRKPPPSPPLMPPTRPAMSLEFA